MPISLSSSIMHSSCRTILATRFPAYFMLTKARAMTSRYFQTRSEEESRRGELSSRPGSAAFADCETDAIADLFYHFAKVDGGVDSRGTYLTYNGVKEILKSINERNDDEILEKLMHVADSDRDGKLYLQVSMHSKADLFLCGNGLISKIFFHFSGFLDSI